MNDEDIKALGLRARSFKAARTGRQRPSNDLLYTWFIGKVQLVRKADVQAFDVWIRSEDGINPYRTPNGLQNSIFPTGWSRQVAANAASIDWLVYEVNPMHWALTVGGHLALQSNVHKLPE